MMIFIRAGYSKQTAQDRINFGLQLQKALEKFNQDFLPHMRQEEEVSSFLYSFNLLFTSRPINTLPDSFLVGPWSLACKL